MTGQASGAALTLPPARATLPGMLPRRSLMSDPGLRAFATVGVLALAVRIAAVLYTRATTPYSLHGDAILYDELARGILSGAGFAHAGRQTGIVTPGYPFFLAAIYAAFGASPLAVALIQSVLGAATAGSVASIALRLYGARGGYLAGTMTALYPHFVIWTEQVLTETLFLFLCVASLWLLVRSLGRATGWSTVGAAVALAAGALVRTELLAFVPLAALISTVRAGHRRGWRSGTVLIAVPLLAVGAWTARNVETVGIPSPATESGSVLWTAFNPRAAELHSGGYAYTMPLPDPPPDDASEAEAYRRSSTAAMAQLRAHPEIVLTYMPAKLANMWRPTFDGSKVITWIVFGGSYLAAMLLAAAGLLSLWRRGVPAEAWLLVAYVVALTAVHALTIAEIRYRMPIEAALLAFGGGGAAWLIGRLTRPAGSQRGQTTRSD